MQLYLKSVVLPALVIFSIVGTISGQSQTTVEDECHNNDGLTVDCPSFEDEFPVYYPYPYDCTKFIECTNGEPEVHCCANGTIWDQSIEVCNHPAVTPCVILTTQATTQTTTTPTTTTPTTTTPTTTTPTTTTPTTTTPTTTTPTTTTPTTTTPTTTTPTTTPVPTSEDPANWICPPGYLGPIGHPYTCEQFYSCDPGNRPCLYDCPADLYFDPIALICEWPANIPSGLCDGGTPPPYTPWTTTGRPRNTPEYIGTYRTAERSYMDKSAFKVVPRQDPCENPVTVFYRV